MNGDLSMTTQINLPLTNGKEYYEIRLESIGGLGANLCGKMLGELGALYLELNSSSFSSYGSEKRGSPVKSFIRWCAPEKELRINSPVTHPDILVIFHEGLVGKCPVLDGITPTTRIILNTPLSPEDAVQKYGISTGILYCIDALSIAMESKSRINMILLGAIVKASGFIPLEQAKQLCEETIGKKYPDMIQVNLQGLQQGFDSVSEKTPIIISDFSPSEHDSSSTGHHKAHKFSQANVSQNQTMHTPASSYNEYVWGWKNAPMGGVNPRFGSTVSNDLSPSREGYIPLFIEERCINCGLCDSTCPDMVFQFHPGIYKDKPSMINGGLDYYHCKGCLRCVEICPTNALIQALEKDYPEKPRFVPNEDLLPDAIDYEKTAPNPWITSDSYLTVKRVDGGIL